MLFSILLITFVSVNLVLFILFLLTCIFAHKLSPVTSQQKSDRGRSPTEGSAEQRIRPKIYWISAATTHPDHEDFSVRYSNEDQQHTVQSDSVGSATGDHINTTFLPDDRLAEQTTDILAGDDKNQMGDATEIAETDVAVSRRRAVESLTPSCHSFWLSGEDPAEEDGPDYVNMSQLTNPDQNNPEYVNITDINRPIPDVAAVAAAAATAAGDEGECYVNLPLRRPPSYFDVFTSDVHRQMNKFKRLSQQVITNLFSQAADQQKA